MLAAVLAAMVAAPALAQDSGSNPVEALEAPSIEVISTTPLPTLGIPRDRVPSNVQGGTAAQIQQQRPLNLADFMNQNIGNLNINEIGTNPYQPDVNFRGFTASPLLGTPQGLSVFQDGVRINEPFGDIVNWDLIPEGAISSMNVIPGSSPVYGLNTLGGALAIRTKSGRQFPGLGVEAYGGSFGRKAAEVEYGGKSGDVDYYANVHWLKEDGWRDFSPSTVRQFFGKVGHETGSTDFDLSVTHADNDLIGNELVPLEFFNQRRESVFTRPDQTLNKMTMVNLTGSHYVNDGMQIAGNIYHRRSDRDGLNGDTNDEFEDSPNDAQCDTADFTDPGDIANCLASQASGGTNADTAAQNKTRTTQTGSGASLQFSMIETVNQLTVGASVDTSESNFQSTEAEGIFDATRQVVDVEPADITAQLQGKTRTISLYVTDTYAVTPATHVTLAGRYNRTRVQAVDELTLTPPNLDGDFTYSKLNPAIGATHKLSDTVTLFGSWSQGNRAPSPIELGCADPNNPCPLPNARASDPFLQQVVARTWEAGIRGRAGESVDWTLSAFQTTNQDDIIFISSTAATGYFTNFGKTQRQGLEAGLSARFGATSISAGYGFTRATYQASACLLAENNSTRGTSPECATDDQILVSPGDQIPGIPEHSLKLQVNFDVTTSWNIGLSGMYFSKQYVRGNENNAHQAGTFTDRFGDTRTFLHGGEVEAYTVVNLRTAYRIGKNFEIFGRVNNLFDKKYFTAGALAENPFDAAGTFQTDSGLWTRETFLAPGAPRGLWVGLRYDFNPNQN
ncbi:MAG: TonB-dependent receptor [Burkholderiales bacterium]